MAHRPDNSFAENFLRRDGRLNRLRYFKRNLVILLLYFVIITIISIAFGNQPDEVSTFGMLLIKAVSFAVIIPSFCLTVRRLHDLNHDEQLAYALAAIDIASTVLMDTRSLEAEPSLPENVLTAINMAAGIYLLFWKGTRGTNQYGSDPLE